MDLALNAFPAPDALWARYRDGKGLTPEGEKILLQDYHADGAGKAPRYYQVSAINAAIEAIAQGRNRILLVMATGTGKTYTAFQIIWKLWKAGHRKRSRAAEDSAWREILQYFSAATQIGLTATPKETKYVSNIAYFGELVYTYSLKQGIRDGFLAPYKVVKVHIDRDVEGYRPEKGQLDRDGEEVEDRVYNVKDFDRTLVMDGRTGLVAQKITAFLKESGDRFQKVIVFCVDQEHAARMRQALINENDDLVADNLRYVMRITGGDQEGQAELGNFIDPESKYPVLVTTQGCFRPASTSRPAG